MTWLSHHRVYAEILGSAILLAEQILPQLPTKANSTLQILINVAKTFLPKKDAP